MPSGEVTSVRIADIIVERDARVRRQIDPKRLADLSDSIRRIGLIHFPVIRRDMVIVAGETRLEACRALGWDNIPIQWADTLSETENLEIELEENIKRADLSWKDQCDALERYHSLKKSQNPAWLLDDTAEAIGVSQTLVTNYLSVASELKAGNERVMAAPKISVAVGITKRKNERARADTIANIILDGDPVATAREAPIMLGNFNAWGPQYTGTPFNLIHCDFPYGINADKFDQGSANSLGGYRDDFDTYATLIQTLLTNKEKLLGESGHVLFWFSMKYYDYTLRQLRSGFWVDPYPLIWHKSDNRGTLPDPSRGPRRVYEVAFLASHGDRKITTAVSNLFAHSIGADREHMSLKPVPVLQHFFRMFVDSNTRILDPTCGSGTSLVAARNLGATHFLGLEVDKDFHDLAVRNWNDGQV